MSRMSNLELSVAWRYLRSRRGSRLLSFISMIAIGGVVVGVSALIVIMGVMNGLQRDLRDKILVASPDVRVLSVGDDMTMGDWKTTLARVQRLPGVTAAAPFVLKQGLITKGNDYAEAAYMVGIPAQGPGVPDVTAIRQHVVKGGDFRFLSSDGERQGVVLGKRLAERLNAWPGDKVTLVSAPHGVKASQIFGQFIPTVRQFEVSGLFETGMYEYDNGYVFLDLAAAQELAGLDSSVTGLELRAADRWQAPALAHRVSAALGFGYHTMDWQEQNRSLFQALKLEKLGMGIILLLIVVVAAFNIVSTLTMVVTDKTREIGILKAMGMTARAIRRIFLVQGLVIGLVGTGLGLLLGLLASLALDRYKLIALDPQIYLIDHLPVALQPLDVVAIVLASVAIAGMATLYPAVQAARLYPIEAIRHE
jgi:lipoprotein-releasing system permease protein